MFCLSSRCLTALFSLLGLGLSLYALQVETRARQEEGYQAYCDTGAFSCSKVFGSPYGRGFGLVAPLLGEEHPLNQPNSVYGVIFYSTILLMAFMSHAVVAKLQVLLCLASLAGSAYLGYILYFVLKELCPVCISTYLVNFILFVASWCKQSAAPASQAAKFDFGYSGRRGLIGSPAESFKKFI